MHTLMNTKIPSNYECGFVILKVVIECLSILGCFFRFITFDCSQSFSSPHQCLSGLTQCSFNLYFALNNIQAFPATCPSQDVPGLCVENSPLAFLRNDSSSFGHI